MSAPVENPILADALAYADAGFAVGPWKFRNGTKVPLGKKGTGKNGHGSGFGDWSSDPKVVRAVINSWNPSDYDGVGVRPGSAGFVVVDIDVKGNAPGPQWWRTLVESNGDDPDRLASTLAVRTPSNGTHLVFRARDVKVKQSDGTVVLADGTVEKQTGLDVRQDDGFVPVPPIHGPDTGYRTVTGERYLDALTDALDAPEWFATAWKGKVTKPDDDGDGDDSIESLTTKWTDEVKQFLTEHNQGKWTDEDRHKTFTDRIAELRDSTTGRHALVLIITRSLAWHLGKFDVDAQEVLAGTLEALKHSREGEGRDCATELAEAFASAIEKEKAKRAHDEWFENLPTKPEAATDPKDHLPAGWEPADLRAAHNSEPLTPTILQREDGVGLIYRGKTNTIFGETEACKTFVSQVGARQELDAGGRLLVLDYEDTDSTFAERALALGIPADLAFDTDRVWFTTPPGPVPPNVLGAWIEWEPTLVIVDGVTAALELEGLEPAKGPDIARWYRGVLRPLADAGAAVVTLDHVTKSREGRGRYPIESVHKLNGISGSAYMAESIRPLSRAFLEPVEAITRLTVAKDRPGGVRAHMRSDGVIADVHLTAYPDGGVTAHVCAPGERIHAGIEDRIVEHLGQYEGESKTGLRVLGNSDQVDGAIKRLVAAGRVRIERSGATHRHYLTDTQEVSDAA